MQIYFLSRDALSCSVIEISVWLLECTCLKPVNNVICKLYVNLLFSRKEYSLLVFLLFSHCLIIMKLGDNYYILNYYLFFVRRYDFSNLTGIWKGSCRKNQINQFSKRLRQYFEYFENLVGMLNIPIDFLSFKSLKRSSTSSAVVGVRKTVFSLGFLNDS